MLVISVITRHHKDGIRRDETHKDPALDILLTYHVSFILFSGELILFLFFF